MGRRSRHNPWSDLGQLASFNTSGEALDRIFPLSQIGDRFFFQSQAFMQTQVEYRAAGRNALCEVVTYGTSTLS